MDPDSPTQNVSLREFCEESVKTINDTMGRGEPVDVAEMVSRFRNYDAGDAYLKGRPDFFQTLLLSPDEAPYRLRELFTNYRALFSLDEATAPQNAAELQDSRLKAEKTFPKERTPLTWGESIDRAEESILKKR